VQRLADKAACYHDLLQLLLSLRSCHDPCSKHAGIESKVLPKQQIGQAEKDIFSAVHSEQRNLQCNKKTNRISSLFRSWICNDVRLSGFKIVDSLDQLFIQAWCLNPNLLQKTKQWALLCRGCFPFHKPLFKTVVFRPYGEEIEELESQIKWTKVKSVRRAIEKVVRVYQQDASCIVDLCRQCIVFEDLNDIAACINIVKADSDVNIVRVKNRFDPKHSSSISAGCRDVGINLQISTVGTRKAGLDAHICELQLLYMPFAELKVFINTFSILEER